MRGSLNVLKLLSDTSSNPAGEVLREFLMSERALVDFILVKNRAGESDRFSTDWDRLWLVGRDIMLGVVKNLE
jgi:hypothetical protein